MPKVYTLIGLRDGSTTAMDIQFHDSEPESARLARAFLADHTTCDQVEVWREQGLLATLGRERVTTPAG
ncbi:MAG: hypothetical protein E7812_01960 [Phenylobacterium sp.]|nr:MAG: hypothetical protein E7812_01960 [Phenylobacterium sp.]